MTVEAKATIELTVVVELSQPWGPECKLDQVYRQAESHAVGRIQQLIKDSGDVCLVNNAVVTNVSIINRD